MTAYRLLALLPLAALAACEPHEGTRLPTLPEPAYAAGTAAPRVNGPVGTPNAPPAQVSLAPAPNVFLRSAGTRAGGGIFR